MSLKFEIRILLLIFFLSLTAIVKGQTHSLKSINNSQYTDSTAKIIIDSLYSLLISDSDFKDLAIKYSQDGSSYKQGGELDFTPIDNYVAEYRDELLKLSVNEISKPFKTRFGYHIVQMIEKKVICFSVDIY